MLSLKVPVPELVHTTRSSSPLVVTPLITYKLSAQLSAGPVGNVNISGSCVTLITSRSETSCEHGDSGWAIISSITVSLEPSGVYVGVRVFALCKAPPPLTILHATVVKPVIWASKITSSPIHTVVGDRLKSITGSALKESVNCFESVGLAHGASAFALTVRVT